MSLKQIRFKMPLVSLYYLFCFPVSRFLSYAWNLGRFLGLFLITQVIRGIFLTFHYTADSSLAFDSVQYICYEVNFGWLVRMVHFNGASFIFILLYLHIWKGLLLSSYRLKFVWASGFSILFLIIAVAFTGYVLVWSQIRYWAAVVITSLLRVLPVWGESLLLWIWGSYNVRTATLKLFFTIHFLLPFLILLVVIVHLLALHKVGSTTFLGYSGNLYKVPFFPYYVIKDLINLVPISLALVFILEYPYLLGDPEIFQIANPIVSPVHIVPEWYFCACYAILRSIPRKSLGVLLMVLSLIIPIFIFLFYSSYSPFVLLTRLLSYLFIFNFVFISWVGQCPLEAPFLVLGSISLRIYFSLLFLIIRRFALRKILFAPSSIFLRSSISL